MKRVLKYIKDVRWVMADYDSHWYLKKNRRVVLRNALYVVAPARWVRYNKFLNSKLFLGGK